MGSPPAFAEDAHQDPIAILQNEQEEYLKLCTALEEIADALPGNVDFAKAEAAAKLLRDGFASHISSQQDFLFPLLRQRAKDNEAIEVFLAQLEYEHAADQGLAVEVAEALSELVEHRITVNPEMVGYLLRCFFEGYRRHSAWEKHVLFDICCNCLTSQDRVDLTLRLSSVARYTFAPHLAG
jgi:hemerythrin-like domain-containing protein